MERWEQPRHQLGLALLFAIELATQAIMVWGATRYAVTATTSIGLGVYLAAMAAVLVRETRS
jgi:predicted hotdog family 3-hydroxylacyl-ACP dehydratase